ncbi:hypothetical protein DEA8626_01642 [Defluviimonas aquaemixtae]|uniref:Uncharacterized protein n=1 Tax=Albidovulum aquaemixtae TaxID=1542388 RepID=A0A2R8B6B7_9RHOB|nr:hypothetical protein [Defluviimonas aquaemixtae]SPH18112.1 hypothetical protein DEA8626_01642 [Defluviimonas aquaemixtae]
MPHARFVMILLAVIAAAGATLWLAARAGLEAGTEGAALWALPPLVAAGILMIIARRK